MIDQLNEREFQLVQQHLQGSLTPEDAKLFEEKMQDPGFAKSVSLMREIAEVVEIEGSKQLKKALQEEEKALSNPKRKAKIIPFKKILFAAAGVALLLIIAWLISRPSNDVYATYFEPHKNVLVPLELDEVTKTQQVFRAYDQQNYEIALIGFDSLLQINNNPDFRFYRANALMALERNEEARQIFEALLTENATQFLNETKWYLALIYIKQENYSAAEPLLQDLSSNRFYQEKASAILNNKRIPWPSNH